MNPIILGAAVGFVIGLAGFIIVQFWIRPIMGYRKIKTKVQSLLSEISEGGVRDEQKRTSLRKLSAELSKSHNDLLPSWYRIRLQSRRESPPEACGHLMALANTKSADHAGSRVDKLKESLNIE